MSYLRFAAAVLTLLLASVLPLTKAVSQAKDVRCYFDRAPYLDPLILADLSTWESDNDDQVVEINMQGAQGSNRYFGDTKVRAVKGKAPVVYVNRNESTDQTHFPDRFSYQYLGRLKSGAFVLRTWDQSGGALITDNLLLVEFRHDSGIAFDSSGRARPRRRVVIRKLCEIGLGDHWQGEVRIRNNKIIVHTTSTENTERNDSQVYDFTSVH